MDYQGEFTGPEIDARLRKAERAYEKPASGIPASDLSEEVQESLENADSAYQKPVGGIPSTDLAEDVQNALEEASTAYQKPAGGIPASDMAEGVIPDVSEFITKSVDDLVNYYLKSETYTQAEVQALIGQIVSFRYEIAPSISSVVNPQNNVLYLIGPSGAGSDKYEEYVYPDAETGWVKIGDTSIDLTGYVTTEALNAALANYQTVANLVTTFSATPSNEKYPAEKLVYDSLGKKGVISQTQTWTRAADGGWDYVMSDLVYGLIPQANIDLFTSAGATFNETTGYFELNGLTDISYVEMSRIYSISIINLTCANDLAYRFSDVPNLRTVFPFAVPDYVGYAVNMASTFMSSNVEVVPLPQIGLKVSSSSGQMFRFSNKIKKILGILNLENRSVRDVFSFYNTISLETVSLKSIKADIVLQDSSRLSVESILYMINNEAASSAITITLHATAYARAIADSDITAALTNHPNVTLASAS